MKRWNGALVALGLGVVLGVGGALGFKPSEPESICHDWNCKTDAECVTRCGGSGVCVMPNTCSSICLCR